MIHAIVAVERSQGIGLNGQMPWPFLKEDMTWFKQLTLNNVVLMGANTWRSLPKKLVDRVNVVIGKSDSQGSSHSWFDPATAIKYCKDLYPDKDIYIIGGQQLYDSTLELVDKYFVTEIDADYPCDKFFNLTYVKNNYPNITTHKIVNATDTTPRFIIREYGR